ncbi:unnamed protein product [Rotaria sordida]|uniref:Uncharacterized protein n=1 Tax=Rotaria sordida TaxID=392033 RepID=A0A819GYP4_9BILA|nr:unnamed protein product [Rotaria sordida]CAF1350707.1 unnamed protein product [Rotaria sordida]CAF1452266.1 unnamed protein product [Rotaria sordida]CAF3878982.1 unnamed protein product [Rotaria sordida]CAF3891613.1 unnamed protein product [Rotaria sordida]
MSVFPSTLRKQLCTINCKRFFLDSIQRHHPWFDVSRNLSKSSTELRKSKDRLEIIPVDSRILNSDIHILTPDGVLHVHHGPFDRAEICREYNVGPRDLQKIDTDFRINVPVISVRHGKFILFSFRRHRAIVQSYRSIFFVPSNEEIPFEPFGIMNIAEWEKITHAYRRNVR